MGGVTVINVLNLFIYLCSYARYVIAINKKIPLHSFVFVLDSYCIAGFC